MKTININKERLLTTISANKSEHIKDYDEAMEEFKIAGVKALEIELEKFKSDEHPGHISVNITAPVSHEDDYTAAERLIGMSCDAVIILDYNDAQRLVLNEWDWAGDLEHAKTVYRSFIK